MDGIIRFRDGKPTGNAMERSSPFRNGWRTIANGDGVFIFGSGHVWSVIANLTASGQGNKSECRAYSYQRPTGVPRLALEHELAGAMEQQAWTALMLLQLLLSKSHPSTTTLRSPAEDPILALEGELAEAFA